MTQAVPVGAVCMVSFLAPAAYSGAATQAWLLAGRLACRGLRVIVLTGVAPASSTLVPDGVRLVHLRVPRSRLGKLRFALASWWWILSHRGLTAVHIHGAYWETCGAAVGARLAGVPCVVKTTMIGEDDLAHIRRERRFGRLLYAAFRGASRFVATSKAIRRRLEQAGVAAEAIVDIPNGVDLQRFAARHDRPGRRRGLGLAPDAPLVVFVGIVDLRKGVDVLLPAWRSVRARIPDAGLLLVGPVSDPALQAAVGAAVRDGVSAVGSVDDVRPYLEAADAFVLPSRQEGLPNAVLEAMASGLPVVACDAEGALAGVITDGVDGRVVPHTPEAVADAIVEILRDPRRAADMGDRARQKIERDFDIDRIADRFRDLYAALARPDAG